VAAAGGAARGGDAGGAAVAAERGLVGRHRVMTPTGPSLTQVPRTL
jgi:hypothetical protein